MMQYVGTSERTVMRKTVHWVSSCTTGSSATVFVATLMGSPSQKLYMMYPGTRYRMPREHVDNAFDAGWFCPTVYCRIRRK